VGGVAGGGVVTAGVLPPHARSAVDIDKAKPAK